MKRKSAKPKNDGIREEPIELLFGDFINNINYFDDVSLKRTIHFFTKYKDTGSYLSLLAGSLFVADNYDNSVLYFQKKTTIGFMLVSGYYDVFMKFLHNIDVFDKTIVVVDEIIPNKWTSTLPSLELYSIVTNSVKKFIDENINISDITGIYKEYFCLNYRTMKTKDITDITCEDKKFSIKGITKKQKERLTKEQQEELIKKQIEEQKEKQKIYKEQEERQIYEEIIIKLSFFIYYCFQIKNKIAMKIIMNHYILNIFKSDRAIEYNISLVLGNKSYSHKDLSLYNSFTNIDVNNSFRLLRYLYQNNYKTKQFSTCGETTLLNILNYCLINEDGTFNTDKILNEDIVTFYETKTMSQISEKGGKIIMTEWLDIVSNLKLQDAYVYNYSGDIHNNVKNIACVLNKLVYNKETCELEDLQKFIVDTIKYISNKPINIEIENSTENSISMIIDNTYSLFFRPGHGEMNIIVKNSNIKIKIISLNTIDDESDEFDIIYSFYKKILTNHTDYGDKMDYDESVSDIIITKFIPYTDKKIIQVILSTVKKIIIDNNIEFFGGSSNNFSDKILDVCDFFDKIRNVTSIILSVNEEDTDLFNAMIENIPEYLTKVNFFNIRIDDLNYDFDLRPLAKLKNLETILLYNIITPYIEIPNLKSFTYNSSILNTGEDIEFIKNYKKLENLDLTVTETFDMNILSGLVNLKSIKLLIKILEDFFDFEIFKNLIKLEDLFIRIMHNNSMKIENIDVLKKINLKSIYLSNINLTSHDLDVIFNLIDIKNIQFSQLKLSQDTMLVIKNKNIKKNLLDSLNKYRIEYTLNPNYDKRKIIMMYETEIVLEITILKNTELKQVFDKFTKDYGTGYKFFINNKKIKDSDTLEKIGIDDDEVVIKILDKETESPKNSSSKRPSSSSKRPSPKRKSSSSKRKSSSSKRPSSSSKRPSSSSKRKSSSSRT